ncbi:NTP/NDP exchange transporter [Chondromyces crocatus]|uniref:MFS transporter n=1 Tax=Chondromyces crocatus TaxID=52 RepID=A0A0K1ERK7_CHOCO|nr:MFS transporter [Chondromyces crocatus]AKT43287.1 MFS transporter [Chondromyces crocatus]
MRPGEVRALLGSFAYFFCLLCSYYILRPVREEMGITGGVKNLPWLFTGTFVAMLAAVPLYAAVVARFSRRRFIPIVYRFFTLNLLVFYALFQRAAGQVGVAQGFYIWTSVFNLFVVSVFWGFMADLWRSEEGKRLFGFIAAGGSAGALAGPLLAGQLAGRIGVLNLLLIAAVVLELAAQCAGWLSRRASSARVTSGETARGGEASPGRGEPSAPVQGAPSAPGEGTRGRGEEAPEERIGHGLFSGLRPVFRSPYLLGISGITLLTTLTSTVLYWQQMHVISAQIADRAERTALFASMDLYTNILSLVVQAFVTGQVMRRVGLVWALAAVPVVSAVGFLGLAVSPVIALFVIFQVIRRAAHYGLERPAREVLFTVVPREEKYTSKGFIDTVVYRGGDAASVWASDALAPLIGAAGLSLAMLPVCALWIAVNVRLARRHAVLAREKPPVVEGSRVA